MAQNSTNDTANAAQRSSRHRQLIDADCMSDWLTKQVLYGIFGASYSRRLVGYDLVGNGILNKQFLDFLLFKSPGPPSRMEGVIPTDIICWFRNRTGLNEQHQIEVPEGKSDDEAIEELSRIWFEVMISEPGFSGLPREIFTNASTARRFQNRARDLGIEHMLEAWSRKVPLSDIIV